MNYYYNFEKKYNFNVVVFNFCYMASASASARWTSIFECAYIIACVKVNSEQRVFCTEELCNNEIHSNKNNDFQCISLFKYTVVSYLYFMVNVSVARATNTKPLYFRLFQVRQKALGKQCAFLFQHFVYFIH